MTSCLTYLKARYQTIIQQNNILVPHVYFRPNVGWHTRLSNEETPEQNRAIMADVFRLQ